ncbi:TPA: hypothetical protein ACG0AT_003768, partial [Elizabethkingia anophelis]
EPFSFLTCKLQKILPAKGFSSPIKILVSFFVTILSFNFSLGQNYSQFDKSDTISISSKVFQTERKIKDLSGNEKIEITKRLNNKIKN